MPWLLEYRNQFYAFYNVAEGHHEQSGLALSALLLHWVRDPANPVKPGVITGGRAMGLLTSKPLRGISP